MMACKTCRSVFNYFDFQAHFPIIWEFVFLSLRLHIQTPGGPNEPVYKQCQLLMTQYIKYQLVSLYDPLSCNALVSTNWIFSLSMTHLMSHAQYTSILVLFTTLFLIASQQQGLTANDIYTAHSPFPILPQKISQSS